MSIRPFHPLTALALAAAANVAFAQHSHDHTAPATQPAEAQAAAEAVVPYTLGTCPVSGEPLDSMGEPVSIVHEGREVKFCCDHCVPTFHADPQKHLDKIDAAIADDQRPIYPLTDCLVSDTPIGNKVIERVHEGRLVRLCCDGCVTMFNMDSGRFMAKLDEAVIEQQKDDYPLEACPISGGALGSMGEPHDVVVAGRLVRLCCAGCEPDLMDNPRKAIAKIDAARGNAAPATAQDGHGHVHH